MTAGETRAGAAPVAAARGGVSAPPRLLGARLALSFLTVLPAGRLDGAPTGEAWLSRAAAWFPVVGALVGGVGASVVVGADAARLPVAVSGALAVVATVVVTRGLHEDGLADTADGLGVHGSRERRLAAMRDSAVGAHGALAIGCALLLSALALATLDAPHAGRALIAAHVLSRTAMVLAAAALPNARRDGGLGRGLAVAAPIATLTTALGVGGALVACGARDGAVVLAACAAALLVALAVQQRALGGRTGDTLGATGKLVEVAALVALSGAWS
jgi:adenosylcobinamide-GDP ribazoletransferase